MSRLRNILIVALIVLSASACQKSFSQTGQSTSPVSTYRTVPISSSLIRQLVAAAIEQTTYTRTYDATYVKLDYPAGDVPLDRGVCSDVVVRAFRKNGVDLQKEIHEDMAKHFSVYPRKWGLSSPDSNIDHRRVPNLMTFFKRQGKELAVTDNARDYLPGDIVTWQLDGNATHIGIVTNILTETDNGFQVVHNIGAGVVVEDVLFAWRITGHYRYFN